MVALPSTPERANSHDESQIPSPSTQSSGSPKYKPRQSIRLKQEELEDIANRRSLTPKLENRSSSHMTFFYKENLKELNKLQDQLMNKKSKLDVVKDEAISLNNKVDTVEFKLNNLKEEKQLKVRQIRVKENELKNLLHDFELKKEFMNSGFELENRKIDGKYESELIECDSKYSFDLKQVEFEKVQRFKQEKELLIVETSKLNHNIDENPTVLKKLKKDLDVQYSSLKENWMKGFQDEWKNLTSANQELVNNIEIVNNKINQKLKPMLSASNEKNKSLKEELEDLEMKIQTRNDYLHSLSAQMETVKEETTQALNQRKELDEYINNSKTELLQIHDILIKEETIRRKLHNEIQELKGNIRVYCRIRPLLSTEIKETGHISVSKFDNHNASQSVQIIKDGRVSDFYFDRVFNTSSTNSQVFDEVGQLIQSSLDGYNVCIFAYGQTGSGKTFTMLNDTDGVIPMTLDHFFDWTHSLKERGWHYQFKAQFVEIYNEQIIDLLRSLNNDQNSSQKYEIRHNPVLQRTTITNVTTIELKSRSMVNKLLKTATKMRSTASTNSNERSSRSHSIFTIHIHGYNSITEEKSDGVLNLVDLAGSERIDTSNVTGERLRETQNINRSLSCLGDVIYSLNGNDNKHIPFRNSKLTYLLQYSLLGNSKTLMFVNVSPSIGQVKETINSLRFASKVNAVKLSKSK